MIPAADIRTLRSQVQERAQGCCEYCLLPEAADLVRYELDGYPLKAGQLGVGHVR